MSMEYVSTVYQDMLLFLSSTEAVLVTVQYISGDDNERIMLLY